MKKYAVLLAAMVALTGCGDEDGNVLSEYEGIWEVQSYTANLMSCEPGELADNGPGFFVVYVQKDEFFGTTVNVDDCDSIDDCKANYQEQLDDDSTLWLGGNFQWTLQSNLTTDGYSSLGAGDQCDGTLNQTSVDLVEDELQISTIYAPSGPFAQDSDGFCSPEEAGIELDESKCNRNEVLKAVKVNKLEGVSAEAQIN